MKSLKNQALIALASVMAVPLVLAAQGGRGGAPQSENMRAASAALREGRTADALAAVRKEAAAAPTSTAAANMLDVLGATAEAKAIFQKQIDTAVDPAAKAAAQRAMAMSYAFDGDCANTVKYEEMVIAYWVTRESAEPQNAFYQEGEMANEAARVCIDQGQFDVAERLYKRGAELGNKEPEPRTHPKSLWDFRTTHALARLAARRGNATDAKKHVADARRILDSDKTMAEAQERFFPYLTGFVALYTNDLKTAETELTKAITTQGNTGDPYMHTLLALTYEKLGQADKAKELFTKAYGLATAHNPPAAYVRPFARKKLGL
jgi:tetratricopeptide (TPR) repeat protein